MEQLGCCIRVMNKLRVHFQFERLQLSLQPDSLSQVTEQYIPKICMRPQGPYQLINEKKKKKKRSYFLEAMPAILDTMILIHIQIQIPTRHILEGRGICRRFFVFFPSFGFTLGPPHPLPKDQKQGMLLSTASLFFSLQIINSITHCYCKISQVCSISCAFCFLLL